jgi:hypothetical protein
VNVIDTTTTLRNVVDGELVDALGDDVDTVINPATEEALAQAPQGTAADVDRAIVGNRHVRMVSLTGSVATGKAIAAAASTTLARYTWSWGARLRSSPSTMPMSARSSTRLESRRSSTPGRTAPPPRASSPP